MSEYDSYLYKLSDDHITALNYIVLASLIIATTFLGIIAVVAA